MRAKRILTSLLAPAAAVSIRADGLRRLWAFARLSARLGGAIDDSIVVLGVPEVHGTARIRLGKNLYLYRELYLETRGEGSIEIGDGVVVSRGVHIVSFARIAIGANSMIGEYTSVRDANHRIGSGAAIRESGHDAEPVVIGRNVWIGRGVTILPGVTIGDGAVIGANAVVTRNIEPGTIAVGIPAKTLRSTAGAS